MNKKEIQHKGISVILTCITKYFCMRIEACNLRKPKARVVTCLMELPSGHLVEFIKTSIQQNIKKYTMWI
jgi:hypothetical protein